LGSALLALWLTVAAPARSHAGAACGDGTRAARVAAVVSAIFPSEGACAEADQNGDGLISAADVLAAALAEPSPPSPTPTPPLATG
jgi:hypothetical protein